MNTTESQMWRQLAKEFVERKQGNGLCGALRNATEGATSRAHDRLHRHLEDYRRERGVTESYIAAVQWSAFASPKDKRDGRNFRALICLMLALEAESEGL